MSHGRDRMSDVFAEWTGRAATDKRTQLEIEGDGCFALHRVRWQESFVANEARRLICHFRAPDAESVRIALGQGGIPVDAIWTGTIHDGTEPATANIVIERDFSDPLPAGAENASALALTGCLIPHGFKLVRAVITSDRKRIICFCEAPDEASLHLAQNRNNDAPGFLWSCRRVAASP